MMRLATAVLTIAMMTAATGAMRAADLSGKWTIDGDVQGNPVGLACTLQQSADATITGKCVVNGSENTDVEGAAKDATFKFTFTVQGYLLTYTGTTEGDSMSGDIEVAGVNGKFSGKRG